MLPEKTWNAESVLRLLLGVFGTLCVGLVLAGALVNFNPDWSDATSKLVSMMIITVSFHGAAVLWIRHFLKQENMSWHDAFGLTFKNFGRIIGIGIVAAFVVLPVAWALQQLTAWLMTLGSLHPEPQQVVQEMQKSGVPAIQQIYLGIVAMIAAPVAEEMLFRGIIYPAIKRAGYPKLALWGASILFSLSHQNMAAFLALVFFAVVLTLLYEHTGNLLASIAAHSCFNATNFVLLLWGNDLLVWTKQFFQHAT